MKVAIIGAGFAGLAAAIELVDHGHEVTLFEADKRPGGMAVGFSPEGWGWGLERYYHHIFTNDIAIIDLARKVGLPPFFLTPKANSLINGKQSQLDSPLSLLTFGELSMLSRVQMGFGLLILKLMKNGTFFEKGTASKILPWLVGKEGYEKIWEPLLLTKFGPYASSVNMAWFWARIYKRTQGLGYFEGGFGALADKMVDYVQGKGGKIRYSYKVKAVRQEKKGGFRVDALAFDRVLVTLPAPLADKLIGKDLVKWPKIDYLWCQNLILELETSLMSGYWLNILEKGFPFMVAVEHTNFVDKKHYGGKTIVYLGNYLPGNDKRLKMTEEQLFNLYLPYLMKINPNFERKWVRKSWCFEVDYAQPVFPVNYSRNIPPIETQVPGLYVANMSMVYPWDRGTNYAIELGQKAAALLMKND